MRDLTLGHCRAALYGEPWAILPEKLSALAETFERRAAGLSLSNDQAERIAAAHAERIAASVPGAVRQEIAGTSFALAAGGVAILPLIGTVVQRPGLFSRYSGGVSAEQFAEAARQLIAREDVSALVFDVDSPGGSVAGVPEAAAVLAGLRKSGGKPIAAVSNTLMASAAYWLASAAREVVTSPSSLTGSIGVYALHEDQSRAEDRAGYTVSVVKAGRLKAGGLPHRPLSDDARKGMQERVDAYYGQFVQAVALHRNVSRTVVRAGFGEGDVLTADRAVAAGLADRVESLPLVVRRLGGKAA